VTTPAPYGRSIHAFNPHATGNRVYGGSAGPSRPTFGQVNPEGYVAREQRRSGLARAILGRGSPGPTGAGSLVPSQMGELVSRHPYSVLAREALARRRRKA